MLAWTLLLVGGCLVNASLHEERAAALRDADGDGWSPAEGDCDDDDPAVNPEAEELCDGADDDCNGLVDDVELVEGRAWLDADGDGYGDPEQPVEGCPGELPIADNGEDCDDGDPGVYPGARESCDGVDQDCDGEVDEDAVDAELAWTDLDGDGWGDEVTMACPGEAVASVDGDCDDLDPAVNPEAEETLDGVDEDCDGRVDDLDPDGAGAWLGADAAEAGQARLGTALAWVAVNGEDRLVAGGPGPEGVPGSPCEARLLDPAGGEAQVLLSETGTRCGAALAADGTALLLGAPADGGGRVERRDPAGVPGAAWTLEPTGGLGAAVALGDLDGDGLEEAVLGAPDRDGTGAVYLLAADAGDGDAGALADALWTGPDESAALGAVLATGDADGDGYADLLLAAPGWGSGAAWLLAGSSGGPASLDGARARLDGVAATALAVADDGSWWVGAAEAEGGRGRVLGLPGEAAGVLGDNDALAAITGEPGMRLGAALAARDGTLAVGAPATAGGSGAVFVWEADAPTDLDDAAFSAWGAVEGRAFATALALSPGGTLAAGAPGADGDAGAAWVLAP